MFQIRALTFGLILATLTTTIDAAEWRVWVMSTDRATTTLATSGYCHALLTIKETSVVANFMVGTTTNPDADISTAEAIYGEDGWSVNKDALMISDTVPFKSCFGAMIELSVNDEFNDSVEAPAGHSSVGGATMAAFESVLYAEADYYDAEAAR